MPAYNADRFISNSINSVINQTYQNWELLIVDDNSSDNTYSIAKEISRKDKRIKIYQFNSNKGASLARELAYTKSKGDYVAFLDSDDQWKETKLEMQVDFMLRNKILFSFTGYEVYNESNKHTSTITPPLKISFEDLLKTNVIGCLTVMVNKKNLKISKFPNTRTRNDYLLWLTILNENKIFAYSIRRPLSKYIVHKHSLTSNKLRLIFDTFQAYDYYFDKSNKLKILFYALRYFIYTLKRKLRKNDKIG